eukprot:COSAG05_NODE_16257_length_350_cov_0.812749_1_plen_67_part_10
MEGRPGDAGPSESIRRRQHQPQQRQHHQQKKQQQQEEEEEEEEEEDTFVEGEDVGEEDTIGSEITLP